MMVIVAVGAFLFGMGVGAASIIRQVQSGRLEAGGRIYFCKDTGPVVRGASVMLIITVEVNAPAGQAIGIKEDFAMYLEKFGDSRVVSVVEQTPEQLRLNT